MRRNIPFLLHNTAHIHADQMDCDSSDTTVRCLSLRQSQRERFARREGRGHPDFYRCECRYARRTWQDDCGSLCAITCWGDDPASRACVFERARRIHFR